MNKTVNINLAGLFFHIDENAFDRLQRYLAAVRKSFAGTSGADEIMSDIESRIAELFLEKRANDQQVISINHVEDVIEIMGQPEDYEVDEDIFDEGPSRSKSTYNYKRNKQLFRDSQNGYIGGVSAGIGHFVGLDAIWVRLLWLLFAFITVGWAVPIYILLWIFVPDAVTTNQRLTMMGKDVNISNIEENFKAGFKTVVDGQTDASHHIVGQKGKRATVRFFNATGRFILGICKALVKLIGLLLFLVSTIALVALIVSTITASAVSIEGYSLLNLMDLAVPTGETTTWLVVAVVLVAGIPLFLLAVLGLKLLVSNMKAMGSRTYLAISAVWIVAVIAMSIMIGNIVASRAIDASVQQTEKFSINQEKVFALELEDTHETIKFNRNGVGIFMDEINGEPIIKYYDVRIAVGSTTDSLARVELIRKGKGASFEDAKSNARLIEYEFKLTDSSFVAPDYFIVPQDAGTGLNDLEVMIYLPEGTQMRFGDRFSERYRSYISKDAFKLGNNIEYLYQITDGKAVCIDCPVIEELEEDRKIDTDKNAVAIDSIDTSSSTNIPENDGDWKYDGQDGVIKKQAP